MKFAFEEQQEFVRNDARRFLNARCPMDSVRAQQESDPFAISPLWQEVCDLGWTGVAIPEIYGGLGMGYLELCVLAEELGRVAAPIPFASSIYLAAEAILHFGSEEQKLRYLPRLASGTSVGALAWNDAKEDPVTLRDGLISGSKRPVTSGTQADIFVIKVDKPEGGAVLAVLDLGEHRESKGFSRRSLKVVDPSLGVAEITFNGVPVDLLVACGDGDAALASLLDRAAVVLAFEQLGGADRCLEMAVDYVKERQTFGRSVGSYQAVKHKLASMYARNELARSNAFYGAWALASGSPELPMAASAARITACDSFEFAARESLHLHGGMGYTWEVDCHLHLKRSLDLALRLGGVRYWKESLIATTLAACQTPANMPSWLANS
ncbi:MAG: acyl-CoA dehydrogenase family protein [Pseudomonadota bacterium]